MKIRNCLPLLVLLSLLAMLALVGVPCFAQGTSAPSIAPENPAFLGFMQNPKVILQAMNDFEPGLVPEPINLPAQQRPAFTLKGLVTSLPPTYDLRPLNKLTPVRDQGSCGSCWDFATMGSMESSLMPGESFNASENNLKNLAGFTIGCCSGGNRTMSTAYLARWGGAITETADPYNPASCVSPTGLVAAKHVQDVIYLPVRTGPLDNDALKQAVMTYGAVYTTYYHSNSYYNSTTASYNYNGSSSANHAVCIVGWDDSYAASKFLSPPAGNGAFLIRNSWGSWWGMSGYFWMSYYDSRLGMTENAVFLAQPTSTYNGIYQYDTLGWTSNMGYGTNTAWFANVFTATSSNPIAAASWYAAAPNSTYTLYVYTNPTTGPINTTGPVAIKTGTIETAGYHTIALDSAVPVTAGQKFSVVVKITTPGYGYPVPIERPYSGYTDAATAAPGQSYTSSTGTSWSDITASYINTNVCLKAFTASSTVSTPGVLSVTPVSGLNATGTVGGPFAPSSQVYTLTNTGGSSINWTAAAGQTWLTLSATSGTLAAGASATVTASINSTANALAVGSYTDSIAFTNATNGSGSAARAVALNITAVTPPAPGVLSVTPTTNLTSTGLVGGPFTPTSQAYTLTNTGETSINWSAAKTQNWTTLSASAGALAAGATAQVTVSINTNASVLVAGSYADTVTFTNTSNGVGNATRSVALSVTDVVTPPAPGVLAVSAGTLNSSGPVGGAFAPASQTFTLTNVGETTITWTAADLQNWTTLSATTGALAKGATALVTVSINSNASVLPAGSYADTITFTNTTNGVGNAARSVNLSVTPVGVPTGKYQIMAEPYAWTSPTYHTKIAMGDNTVSPAVNLPFTFTFYGKTYNSLYVGSNGLMGFVLPGMTYYANTRIPYANGPNAAIYPYWGNLNPSRGGFVSIGTEGVAPNRRVIVSWVNVPWGTTSLYINFTFQAVLYEGSNDIVFRYSNVSPTTTYGGGRYATVGIENETGTAASLYSYNTAGFVTNNKAIRFGVR